MPKRLKIEGRNIHFDGKLCPPLPPRLQGMLQNMLEMGEIGINPGSYFGLKRKSVAANYIGALRVWLREADLPLRIVSTVGCGAPWESTTCPHCGHVKKIMVKGRTKGCYVLERIPPRPTRTRRDVRNGATHNENKGL